MNLDTIPNLSDILKKSLQNSIDTIKSAKLTDEDKKNIDTEFVMQWLNDLETGKYKQAHNILISNNAQSFCCLGVACKTEGLKIVRSDGVMLVKDDEDYHDAMPSKRLLEKMGVFDIAADIANLNDSERFSFTDIASILRTYYSRNGIDLTVSSAEGAAV